MRITNHDDLDGFVLLQPLCGKTSKARMRSKVADEEFDVVGGFVVDELTHFRPNLSAVSDVNRSVTMLLALADINSRGRLSIPHKDRESVPIPAVPVPE
jgi:hypothetical protein